MATNLDDVLSHAIMMYIPRHFFQRTCIVIYSIDVELIYPNTGCES